MTAAKIIVDILIILDIIYGAKQFWEIILAFNSDDGGGPIRPKVIKLLISIIILIILIILRIKM